MDADVAVPGADVALECGLLLVREDIAARRQPDDDVVAASSASLNAAAILRGVDAEPLAHAHLGDRGGPVLDALRVPEAGGAREDERSESHLTGHERGRYSSPRARTGGPPVTGRAVSCPVPRFRSRQFVSALGM